MIYAIEEARRVMLAESSAIARVGQRIDGELLLLVVKHVERCVAAGGTVHAAGVGKSGNVARHLADKLCSIHVPANYLCPLNALHGDLGRIRADDVVFLISRSGSCVEISTLAGVLKMHAPAGAPVTIGLTADPDSDMGRQCDVVLNCEAGEEACPHNLVPTVSTAVAYAVADALVLVLMQRSGFQPDRFIGTHPGGDLGQREATRTN